MVSCSQASFFQLVQYFFKVAGGVGAWNSEIIRESEILYLESGKFEWMMLGSLGTYSFRKLKVIIICHLHRILGYPRVNASLLVVNAGCTYLVGGQNQEQVSTNTICGLWPAFRQI